MVFYLHIYFDISDISGLIVVAYVCFNDIVSFVGFIIPCPCDAFLCLCDNACVSRWFSESDT